MLALRAVFLLAGLCAVHGYGSGAPPEACGDMIPQHHTPPQNSVSPYGVRVLRDQKSDTVRVTISGGKNEKFKGFMIQGRVGDTPVGKFINPPSNVKLIDCGGGKWTAATHADKEDKDYVTLTWKAPPNLKERVVFLATVAKNGGEFWVGTPSQAIQL